MKESIKNFFSLEGRVALVTGGNGGIGKGIARGLAGAGANVVIAARNKAKTELAAREIENDFSAPVLAVKADVKREEDNYAMVKAAVDRFGRIDIFVSNAGIGILKLPRKCRSRSGMTRWRSIFAVSL